MTPVTATSALVPNAHRTNSFFKPQRHSPKQILVVDDNAMNAELVSCILETHGFRVESTGTAEDAITMARAVPPALILMDINLPGMNGIEATKILKNDPATRHVIVVGLTGDVHQDEKTDFDGYVTKPFQIETLVSSIKSFLSRPAR